MSEVLHFELVSPEKKLISQDVYSVQIPGDEGEFGVLPGHSSLLSSLSAGVLRFRAEAGGETQDIFIAGGFADVTATRCTVLAEEALPVEELNLESLEQRLKDLQSDLDLAEETADRKRIGRDIALVKAKLKAVSA